MLFKKSILLACCIGNIFITYSMRKDLESSLQRSREGMLISASCLPAFACTCPHCHTQHDSIFVFSAHLGIAHRYHAPDYAHQEFVRQLEEHNKKNL